MSTNVNRYTPARKAASAHVALAARWGTDNLSDLKAEWTRLKVLESLEAVRLLGVSVTPEALAEFEAAIHSFPIDAPAPVQMAFEGV